MVNKMVKDLKVVGLEWKKRPDVACWRTRSSKSRSVYVEWVLLRIVKRMPSFDLFGLVSSL